MRQIKFRCFDSGYNSLHGWDEVRLWFRQKTHDKSPSKLSLILEGRERYIPMQYTGLKDSKRTKEFPEGQDIYEGDIVKLTSTMNDHHQKGAVDIARVYFANGKFCIAPDGYEIGTDLFSAKLISIVEVIGNIYEDSHLLEESK